MENKKQTNKNSKTKEKFEPYEMPRLTKYPKVRKMYGQSGILPGPGV
ncbi:MAG: hypothetical protein Q8O13_03760 [Candidatus Omnitrophota bacterium]|nr:hypothetical protein [Candidatus Omnitrophota bacterium]